jgi:murein DD-endopeptidase MepM/ murein hydrolase activator NlpD
MIHLQYNTPGWSDCLSRLPDGALIKLCDMVQTAAEVKAINPKLKTLLRHVNDSGYVWSTDWAANVARAEAEYLTYIDGTFEQYAHLVDYVEEPRNEYVDNGMSAAQVAERVMWARACAYVWKTVFQPRWPHIKALIGAQPVGNDIPTGFFKAAHDYGAGISTHAYVKFNSLGVRDPLDFQYHSGRWATNDTAARTQGYTVPIAITETGPYDGSTWGGWRAGNVLGGDAAGYVAVMRAVIRDWRGTHAYQSGRLIGFNLFTTIQNGWDNYKTNQPELNLLAEMTKQEWIPVVAPPPPPPPPPPEPEVNYVVVANLLPQDATDDEWIHVREMTADKKETLLQSADDAARLVAPGLPGSRVVVWGPERWGGVAAIVAWLQARGVTQVNWWSFPGTPEPPPAPGYDWPIGTAAERAVAVDGLPGDWVDVNGYGRLYNFAGGTAYHTGADLNLNKPSWDADRGKPVYAVADGTVTYAQLVPGSTWGRVVVIRHASDCFSRYGHLATLMVSQGDTVKRGQQIGNIGGIEYGVANHLHFDISRTDRLLTYPTDWPGMTWSRIERDYVPPLAFIKEHKATA